MQNYVVLIKDSQEQVIVEAENTEDCQATCRYYFGRGNYTIQETISDELAEMLGWDTY